MDEQSMRYETYALAIKRMLLFAGLWPGRVSSKIFQLVVVVHVLTAVSTSSAIVNFVFNHINDLSLAMKGLGIAVSFFTIILKVISSDYRIRIRSATLGRFKLTVVPR